MENNNLSGPDKNTYGFAFMSWFVCFLLVVVVLAIVEYSKVTNITNRIAATITNENFCPTNTTNSLCALSPNFDLPIPLNSDKLDFKLAEFACNLVGCLEYSFLKTKSNTTTIQITNSEKNPIVKLPVGVEKRATLYYEGRLIGMIVTTPSTNAIWVVFRGTQTMNEWKQDLMIQQVTSNLFQGLIHKGFLNIYLAIRQGLLAELTKLSNLDSSSIYITGHSLGSTTSQLLLSDPDLSSTLSTKTINKQVHIFGAPRIGNPAFARSQMNQKIFRFINETDIVTNLPPPVSPNFIGNKNDVFIYQNMQQQTILFNDNRYSYEENHAIKMYMYWLKSQVSSS
jgi:hypothetical protein